MAKYFEDIQMDDLDDESTPLISPEQQEYLDQQETRFQRPRQEQKIQNRIQQLSDYLDEDVPPSNYFRMQGKKLQFRKDGIWKDLTDYDGTFKDHSELQFVSDREIPQVYETPRRSTMSESRREIVKQELEKLYRHVGYETDNIELNLDRFKVENEKGFTILSFRKNGKWYTLTKKTDGTFKTPSVIEKLFTKADLRQLGLSPLQRLDDLVPTPKEVEHIELKALDSRVKEVHEVVSELPMRELLGLDAALQRIQGEFVNGTAKLTELEKSIAELQDVEEPTEQQKQRLEQLKEQYDVRLESLSQIKGKLSTQLARMRQTIDKVADGDRTLKERLKILWREQGLTIVSVLTAIGMTISTLVLALLPASGSGGGSTPHKVRDWVKKSLASLARLFGKLAKWALKALPGVIGSILSWIFSLFKKVVTYAAEHAYAALGFAVAAVSYLVFRK